MSAPLLARKGIVAAALFTWTALAAAAAAHCATRCDTACLTDLATHYVDGLSAQHWQDLPWADTVHYAENSVKMMVGDGTWATATAHAATPLIVADPVSGKVAWMGTLEEHGQPAFYAFELTAAGDRIGAVQALIRRKEGRPPFGDTATFAPATLLAASPSAGHAMSRDAMIALATRYFTAQTGGAHAAPVRFGDGCRLIENGVVMSGNLPAANGESGDCAQAFQRGLFKEYETVRQHIVAVDPSRGLVVASGYRDLPAAETSFAARDGTSYPAEAQYPRSMSFMTVFRIENGAIARLETIANEVPYMMAFPW